MQVLATIFRSLGFMFQVIDTTFGLSPSFYWQTVETQEPICQREETTVTQQLHTEVGTLSLTSVLFNSSFSMVVPLIPQNSGSQSCQKLDSLNRIYHLLLTVGCSCSGLQSLFPTASCNSPHPPASPRLRARCEWAATPLSAK